MEIFAHKSLPGDTLKNTLGSQIEVPLAANSSAALIENRLRFGVNPLGESLSLPAGGEGIVEAGMVEERLDVCPA
jgi:hypothetical protein